MPIPRAKTTHGTTDTVLPQSLCGQNWFQSIQVKNAYKGYNKESRTLASLGTKAQLSGREEGSTEQIEAERKRVMVMRHEHFPSLLSTSQRTNIDKYLERARLYIEDAVSLEDAWRGGFTFWGGTEDQRDVMPFPLSIDLEGIQNGFCINNFGHKAKNQWEANCPTADENAGHNKDAEKWQKLMVAAVINIRCAEEVIRKAEVKEANRLAKPAIGSLATEPKSPGPGIGGIKAVPVPGIPVPMPTIPVEPVSMTPTFFPTVDVSGETDDGAATAVIDEAGDEAGDEDVPDDMVEEDGEGALEDEAEVKSSKKKKKSSAPLIAAAGIGALFLFGK